MARRGTDAISTRSPRPRRSLPHPLPGRAGRGDTTDARSQRLCLPTYPTALTVCSRTRTPIGWRGGDVDGWARPGGTARDPASCGWSNDVGPIEAAAPARIGSYVGLDPVFDSFEALEAHVRAVSAPFGPLSDAQWEQLSRTTARQLPDGSWRLKYDPGLAVPFRASGSRPADLWPQWDAIRCPTLVLHGAESDLLSSATVAAMRSRGPRPELIEFAGIGHAPMLLSPEQIAPVVSFLDASA
jgi:pimeloyl-ACP methyl ester carboxylesterase